MTPSPTVGPTFVPTASNGGFHLYQFAGPNDGDRCDTMVDYAEPQPVADTITNNLQCYFNHATNLWNDGSGCPYVALDRSDFAVLDTTTVYANATATL